MTLKEKFKIINCTDCDMPYCDIRCTILASSELDRLEQIADELAIGFAEWLNFNFKLDFTDNAFKELLEVFKKEKGLCD